jgi:hypothetical protein
VTLCANCLTAEASYISMSAAADLAGDKRCTFCRTLAKRPEEYRPLKPEATKPKPPLGFFDLASAAVFHGAQTGRWPVTGGSGPCIAYAGDNVRVVEDWGPVLYSATSAPKIGAEGVVVTAQQPMPPLRPTTMPPLMRFYMIKDGAKHRTIDGWFVVERI